ncbi:MAG: hypothetical protein L6V81_02355 [Clostridium sp.]|nr:MAG: hypothetical protein L6V81_02355 [Clostridium sp.]
MMIKQIFIVMLDSIEDPHNFGAIIRTCECAGVDYIIIPKKIEVLVLIVRFIRLLVVH